MDNRNKSIIFQFYLKNRRLTLFNGSDTNELPERMMLLKYITIDEEFKYYIGSNQFILSWKYHKSCYIFVYPLFELYKHTRAYDGRYY